MLKKIISIALFIFPIFIYGQKDPGFNHNRGRQVDFTLKSIYEIVNGKTLGAVSGYTDLDVYCTAAATTGWRLYAYALSPDFQASLGGGNIGLGKIQLITKVNTITYNTITLSTTPTIIASGVIADGPWWDVTIAYSCDNLLGFNADFYTSDIHIYIIEY